MSGFTERVIIQLRTSPHGCCLDGPIGAEESSDYVLVEVSCANPEGAKLAREILLANAAVADRLTPEERAKQLEMFEAFERDEEEE